jgi:hypothetical protein
MSTRLTGRALISMLSMALITGFVLSGESHAQQKNRATPKQDQKRAADELKKAANQEIKGREAEILKMAYIYLAMANHNYAGHRGKAMNQIQAAIEILDASIMKNGTKKQKAVALKEEIDAARAKFLAQNQAKVHEPQVLSNIQMTEAHRLIQSIKPGLVALNQPAVTEHVKKALQEIDISLKMH